MPGEQFLASHLHELLAYLNNRGVLTIVVLAQAGTLGSLMQSPVDVSYLADKFCSCGTSKSTGKCGRQFP